MNLARVLVIENEPQVQLMLKTKLPALGFEVHIVGHREDPLSVAVEYRPDVVLLDLKQQGRDSLEVCRRLRDRMPSVAVLVSGCGSAAARIAALESCADDYIAKPFDLRELIARIRAALRRTNGHIATAPVVDRFNPVDLAHLMQLSPSVEEDIDLKLLPDDEPAKHLDIRDKFYGQSIETLWTLLKSGKI